MRNEGSGWRLTPAYDLIPDIPQRGEHVLNFGSGSNRPTAKSLAVLAKSFGLPPKKAQSVLHKVATAQGRHRIRALDTGISKLSGR